MYPLSVPHTPVRAAGSPRVIAKDAEDAEVTEDPNNQTSPSGQATSDIGMLIARVTTVSVQAVEPQCRSLSPPLRPLRPFPSSAIKALDTRRKRELEETLRRPSLSLPPPPAHIVRPSRGNHEP